MSLETTPARQQADAELTRRAEALVRDVVLPALKSHLPEGD
jgi:hypothetical protein